MLKTSPSIENGEEYGRCRPRADPKEISTLRGDGFNFGRPPFSTLILVRWKLLGFFSLFFFPGGPMMFKLSRTEVVCDRSLELKGWNSRPKEFCFGKTCTDNMDYPQVMQFHQIPKGFRNQRMLLICKQKPNSPVATSPNIIPHPNTSSLEPKLRFINHQQQSNATHPFELMKIFPPRNGKSSSGPQKVSLVTSKFSPLRRAPALVLLL